MPRLPDSPVDLAALPQQAGWRGMPRKGLSVGIVIVILGLACLGIWFMSRLHQTIETEVGHRAGSLLQATLTRHAQDFADGTLSPGITAGLDAHFRQVSGTLGIFDMIVWNTEGLILYAARSEMTGRRFPLSPQMQEALSGRISVEIAARRHTNGSSETPPRHDQFFEIYVPITLAPEDRIVAVAEYYQDAAVASTALANLRGQIWGAMIGGSLCFTGVLYLLLRQGDAALSQQRAEFGHELTGLAAQREQQEIQLDQIHADLHDGVGQLLTVALLRMSPARDRDVASGPDIQAVQTILEEALTEVQTLLAGTSQSGRHDMALEQAVRAIVDDHRRRTATNVDLRLDTPLPEPSLPVKIAICRSVREGLHNAFKHGGGADQRVALRRIDTLLEVSVTDRGHGMAPNPDLDQRKPIGLDSLRRRIEGLGGSLRLDRQDSGPTRLCATFPLSQTEVPDA